MSISDEYSFICEFPVPTNLKTYLCRSILKQALYKRMSFTLRKVKNNKKELSLCNKL